MNLKDDSTKQYVMELDAEGVSQKEISELTGIPTSTLNDFILGKSYVAWHSRNKVEPEQKEGAVVKIIDIENSPILSYHWGLFNQNIAVSQIKEDWYIMSYAVKTLDINDEVCRILPDMEGYESGNDGEYQLVLELWDILDEADYIIAHNGKAFDNKKIKAKFLQYGLTPPSPYRVIDTLKIVKDAFKLTSNRLEYVAKFLEKEGKYDSGGMATWIACMGGDLEAWEIMREYNLQDTTELEEVYKEVRAWDTKHPNLANFYSDAVERCTVCASDDLEKIDTNSRTNVSQFETLRCNNCGHLNRRRSNLKTKEQMKTTLMNSGTD